METAVAHEDFRDDYDINGRSSAVTLAQIRLADWGDDEASDNSETEDLSEADEDLLAFDTHDGAEDSTACDAQDASATVRGSVSAWKDPLQLTLDAFSAGEETGSFEADGNADISQSGESVRDASDASEHDSLRGYAVVDSDELRDKDISLYLHLGYEQELGKYEDTEHVHRVSHEYSKEEYDRRNQSGLRNTPAAVFDGEEYTSQTQTMTQERAYAGATVLCKVRLWLTLAFALIGIAFDALIDFAPVIGAGLEDFVHSSMYPMLALMWLVLACLPSITHLAGGIRSLWELKPVAYAIPAMAALLTALHTLAACFLAKEGVRIYVGGCLVILFLACLGDCMRTASEKLSFRIASSGKSKFVVSPTAEDASAPMVDHIYDRSFRVRKTERLSDYFLRVTQYDREERRTGVLALAAFPAALAVAGVVVVAGKGAWIAGFSAFMGAYLSILPAMYLIFLALPLLSVNRIIGRRGCAVLHPEAADEYAPGKAVEPEAVHMTFPVGEVLRATQTKAVTVKNDGDAGVYREIANRLFFLLSFPLYDKDYPVREEETRGIRLEIAESDPSSLRLYMMDRQREMACEILLGTHDALTRHGIKLPPKSKEASYKRTEDSRVLYMAFDRKFRVAYAAKYVPKHSFVQAISALGSVGYVLSVISYDPLVTQDLLAPLATSEMPRMEIYRPSYVDEEWESRSGSILATGRAVDVTYPILACRRMKTMAKWSARLSWISLLLTTLGLSLCLGLGIMTHIGVLFLWLWHFLWAGAAYLMIKCGIRPRHLRMTEGNL